MTQEPISGDYVIATKWHDGDPQDQWAVGFFDYGVPLMISDRYFVVDSEGRQFRGNGFRKVKKISQARGAWILSQKELIMQSTKSVWYWVTATMHPRKAND